MAGKRGGGPWYGNFKERHRFEGEALRIHDDLRASQEHNRKLAGRVYRVTVDVPQYGKRTVEIRFPAHHARHPTIFVDGPTESPHRFGDNSLCIWWNRDEPEQRWVFEDGLAELIGHVIVHLFKEAWWRETGEWLGEEAPHASLERDPERTS